MAWNLVPVTIRNQWHKSMSKSERMILKFGERESNVSEQCYMKQVQCPLYLIRANRQRELELHLGALEEQVKYYIALDLYKLSQFILPR